MLADERYDEPLPAGYLDAPDRLTEELTELMGAFTGSLEARDPAALAEARVASFLRGRTPALREEVLDRVGLAALDDDTRLEHRSTAACVLVPDGDRLVVLLGDRELRMPARLHEPMAFVRDHPQLRVGDLAPWLDEESRRVVVRRLIREGLLRIDS